jgi:ABC-2 type transport system permease protein
MAETEPGRNDVPRQPVDTQTPVDPRSTHDEKPLRVVSPRRSVRNHLRDIAQYRELWWSLAKRDLKVKYKNSVFGFVWSLLNPLLYLVVYWFAFNVIAKAGIPNFPLFLLSGLLVWNLLATSLGPAALSITGGASLVKKVAFPREVLPLSVVGSSLVHFFLQFLVLLAAILLFARDQVAWSYLWLVPFALLTVIALTASLSVLLSAVNVRARDTQHLLELVLLAWFWLTPIVYPYTFVSNRLSDQGLSELMLLNPMTSPVIAFQRALYGQGTDTAGNLVLPDAGPLWYGRNLLIVFVVSCVLMVVAIRVFDRLEGSFAEEI